MENNPPSYTLEDLSAESGFDTRVIRHFIEQGLLRGPTSLGRYARYSDRHLVRLLAIKALKENRGMKLTDTRQTLLCMSEPEIDALAETVRTNGANAPGSALDYLRSLNLQTFDSQADQIMSQTEKRRLQSEKQSTVSTLSQNELSQKQPLQSDHSQVTQSKNQESEGNKESQGNTQELFFNGSEGATTSQRQFAPSETLHRFQITPDVELSVRGLQTEQQIARMQNVANRLREYLIGGSNE